MTNAWLRCARRRGHAQVRLIAEGGRIGVGEINEIGEAVFVPLERVRIHRNPDKRGSCRWYNDYRLPERLGGGIVTVRLHNKDEDHERRFNRTENVRQIPPGDPDFENPAAHLVLQSTNH